MFVIAGYIVVLACVLGGYAMAGGSFGVILTALPFELVTIFGGALGAFAGQQPAPRCIKATIKLIPQAAEKLQVHQGALHGTHGAAVRRPDRRPARRA
jgi:flagellar motor component MotA